MTRKVWLEVALNGPWSRKLQPGIPDTVDAIVADGIACAKEGACIVHVHAYDGGGPQTFDWQVYARIIEGIRAKVDVPVYPSLPSAAIGVSYDTEGPEPRFAHVEELAKRGLLEFAVIDPGSVNFIALDGQMPGSVYANPQDHISHGLSFACRHGFHPAYAIYEPGFTRTGASMALRVGAPVPIYRFMFSDTFAWGFPPKPHHLEAHVRLLTDCQPSAPWMIAGLGVDIQPLIPRAVLLGGHVRVGLEDAPLGTELTNAQWTRLGASAITASGGELATAPEMRTMLSAAGL